MTKWNVAESRRARNQPAPSETHAIWRGIGCLLMLIVPVMSFILASITVTAGIALNWPMPYQLLGNPVMPAAWWNFQPITPILGFIQSQTNLYAILLLTVLYIVIISSVMAFGYAVMYRIVGPSRYGPLDAPPPRVRVRSYRR